MGHRKIARWAGLLAVASMMMPLSACNEILEVDNPESIGVNELDDPALLDAQVAGVRAVFAEQMSGDEEAMTQAQAFLTDEQLTGLNWEDWQRYNQRIVNYTEGPSFQMWANLAEIVALGEQTLDRLDNLAPNPGSDRRVALVSALTGYGYVFVAETICQAVFSEPDDPSGNLLGPLQVMALAIPHFQRAVTVGAAASAANLVGLANVGLARAYLTLGDFANAISSASQVTPGFQFWIEYSDASDDLDNNLFNEVHGSNHTIGMSPWFLQGTYGDQDIIDTQTDPRIQHSSRFTTGHDQSTKLYKPYQGLRFSGYTGNTIAPSSAACPNCTGANEGNGDNGDVILFQRATNVLLADQVEALHHMNEAMMRQGGNDAAVNAFVNDRRAVGNEAAVTLTGDALFAELRRQRGRDLFMGGFRLGDLRRWKRDGVGDFFPSGAHPNPERPPATYGPWTCIPMPLEEYEGNPNLDKPVNPLDPPAGII